MAVGLLAAAVLAGCEGKTGCARGSSESEERMREGVGGSGRGGRVGWPRQGRGGGEEEDEDEDEDEPAEGRPAVGGAESQQRSARCRCRLGCPGCPVAVGQFSLLFPIRRGALGGLDARWPVAAEGLPCRCAGPHSESLP
jgi:hypothetical protein